jgi:Transposase.
MNAVGIDVSKGKSTVTIRQPGDKVVLAPRDYRHTQSSINDLITTIKCLEGETKVCMEHTGRYYEPVASWLSAAGIFVSAVNPWLIKDFGNESIRTPKTDKADAKKIARFALDRWAKLPQYSRMFGFGTDAEILSPEDVRKDAAAHTKAVLEMYQIKEKE